MEMDSMGRIVALLLFVFCIRTAASEYPSRNERRSEADHYFTELRSWYDDHDSYSHLYDSGLRRTKRNIKVYVKNYGGDGRKSRHLIVSKRKNTHGKKVKGEWGVLRFTGASKVRDSTLSNNGVFGSDDGNLDIVDHSDDALKKDNITTFDPQLRNSRRRKKHPRKSNSSDVNLHTSEENDNATEIHQGIYVTSSNTMVPTRNPNLPFKDAEGNIVISHHSLRASLKTFNTSITSGVGVTSQKRGIHNVSHAYKRKQVRSINTTEYAWNSAKALWPEVAKSWEYISSLPVSKRDRLLRREKRSASAHRNNGPYTLLVNEKVTRHNGRNNTSNIHDYFRHVFIRNNQTTDIADHPAASTDSQTKVNGTKRQTEEERRKKVEPAKTNIEDNIHDFFRHVFIRKNTTNISTNRFLNTTGAYDVAHGHAKVRQVHRKVRKERVLPRRRAKAYRKRKYRIKKAHKTHAHARTQRKSHRKKAKSHPSITSKVLISPVSTSQDSGDVTLKSAPSPPPEMATSDVKPEKEQEKAPSYPATQLLRSDEVIEPSAMGQQLSSDNIIPTYTAMQSLRENNFGSTYTDVQASRNENTGETSTSTVVQPFRNNNIAPTARRVQWLFNNNITPSTTNTQPLKNDNISPAFGRVQNVKGGRIGPTSVGVPPLKSANIVPTSGLSHYWKSDDIAPSSPIVIQPLLQETVGFALGDAPTSAMNPINAKIIQRKNPAELSAGHMKSEFNPADKKNLVQFRDSYGKVIATLIDPKSWNSANVTLSKADDRRRYMNDWRALQNTGALKREMTSEKALPPRMEDNHKKPLRRSDASRETYHQDTH